MGRRSLFNRGSRSTKGNKKEQDGNAAASSSFSSILNKSRKSNKSNSKAVNDLKLVDSTDSGNTNNSNANSNSNRNHQQAQAQEEIEVESELSSSVYESSYNQYLTQIETDYGVTSVDFNAGSTIDGYSNVGDTHNNNHNNNSVDNSDSNNNRNEDRVGVCVDDYIEDYINDTHSVNDEDKEKDKIDKMPTSPTNYKVFGNYSSPTSMNQNRNHTGTNPFDDDTNVDADNQDPYMPQGAENEIMGASSPTPPHGTIANVDGGTNIENTTITESHPTNSLSPNDNTVYSNDHSNIHMISYVSGGLPINGGGIEASGSGYHDDDLSTLGDESIIRGLAKQRLREQEAAAAAARQKGIGVLSASSSTPLKNNTRSPAAVALGLEKTRTASTEQSDMTPQKTVSPSASDFTYSKAFETNDYDDSSTMSISRIGDGTGNDGLDKQKEEEDEATNTGSRSDDDEEGLYGCVVGGGPLDSNNDNDGIKKDNEPFLTRNKWTIIKMMIFIGCFLLAVSCAAIVVTLLRIRDNNNNNAISGSTDESLFNGNGNNGNSNNGDYIDVVNDGDNLNDAIPPIPSTEPLPPTYIPPPDTGDLNIDATYPDKTEEGSFTSAPTTSPSVVLEDNKNEAANNSNEEAIENSSSQSPSKSSNASPSVSPSTSPILSSKPSTSSSGVEIPMPTVSRINSTFIGDITNLSKIGADLKFIIAKYSPTSLQYMDDTVEDADQPQYKAFKWMIQDPHYWNYTIPRIVQRWTLAVLYYSTSGPNWKTEQLPQQFLEGKSPWMSYTNECDWESSNTGYKGRICKENSVFAIHLRSLGLEGTIPSELGLLSDHLKLIILNNNTLTGTLPTELGQLTMMEKFNVQKNELIGTVLPGIGQWSNLTIAAMGNNQFTGKIPSELGQLQAMKTIGFESNQLSGTLPSELGNMVETEKISVEKNFLTGTIPFSFRGMKKLSSLSVHMNELTGRMPWALCPEYNDSMESLKADCVKVECECCTECFGKGYDKDDADDSDAERQIAATLDNTNFNNFLAQRASTPSSEGGGVRREFLRRAN